MTRFFLVILVMISTRICTAQHYDMQWICGYSNNEEEYFGMNLLDFNNKKVEISFLENLERYEMGFTGSFTNHPESGTLSLHTNACYILDEGFNIVSGEDYIHGDTFRDYCDWGYWPHKQGVILLPDLTDERITYFLSKDHEINTEGTDVYSNNFYGSKVVQDPEGNYTFYDLKKLNTDTLHVSDIVAIPHGDREHWWVFQVVNKSNEYIKYLVGEDTIIEHSRQEIGIDFIATEQDIGQNIFSPDGTIYAVNSEVGIHLYDFDNKTGLLSNYRNISYPDAENVAQGMAFSPSGRFLYVDNATDLYQIDLDLMDEPLRLPYESTYDSFGWPIGLGMMQLGPDCRIYVSPGSTTNWLHVIHQPDEKGLDCMFQPRALELPARIPHHLPNLPNYRYLTGCDSTIQFPTPTSTTAIPQAQDMNIYPNPAVNTINIVSDSPLSIVNVYDVTGRLLLSKDMKGHQFSIDISAIPKGIYTIKTLDGSYARFIKME